MKSKLLAVVVLLLMSFTMAQPLMAKNKHRKKEGQGLVVTSVNAGTGTFVLSAEKGRQTFSDKATSDAIFTINQMPCTLKDIHAGMRVITYTEADEHLLSQLDVEAKK